MCMFYPFLHYKKLSHQITRSHLPFIKKTTTDSYNKQHHRNFKTKVLIHTFWKPKSLLFFSHIINVSISCTLFYLFNTKKEKRWFLWLHSQKSLETGLFRSFPFIALLCSLILSFNEHILLHEHWIFLSYML